MLSNSSRRARRAGWRFFIGLSVLGLLIVASASHAGNRLLATAGPGTDRQIGGYLTMQAGF